MDPAVVSNPALHHYALFSDNVLATAVVVNSTAQAAGDPSRHVFHIVTDRMNLGAMQAWFVLNPPRNMTVDIKSLDDFEWINPQYVPVLRQIEQVRGHGWGYADSARSSSVGRGSQKSPLKSRAAPDSGEQSATFLGMLTSRFHYDHFFL
jgi:alpha-1,4-galacturonosyltransferase